ncbi:MAG: MFS transporter, partial [Sphaerochaetaceae bacterium]|nr:MFS transporter [Sphaerochaetaceae bacterium]
MFKYLALFFFNQATVSAFAPYVQIIFRNKGYSYSFVGLMISMGMVAACFIPLYIGTAVDKTRRTRTTLAKLGIASNLLLLPSMLLKSKLLTAICFTISYGLFWSVGPVMDGYANRQFLGDTSKYGKARAAGTFGYVFFLVIFGLIGFPVETNNLSIYCCTTIILVFYISCCCITPKDFPAEPNKEKKSFS